MTAVLADIEILRRAYASRGSPGYWEWWLGQLTGRRREVRQASALAALGRVDELIELLEQWYEERIGMSFLRYPLYDPVRNDPRFQDFLRRMNLTE